MILFFGRRCGKTIPSSPLRPLEAEMKFSAGSPPLYRRNKGMDYPHGGANRIGITGKTDCKT